VRDVHVAGVGMTRFGKFPDSSVRSLAEDGGGFLGDDPAAVVITILSR
jgi:hypothetical protein